MFAITTPRYLTDDTRYLKSVAEKNRYRVSESLGPVAYVQSNCDTPSERDDYVAELMRHIKVDSYGKCLHNRQATADKDSPDYLELLGKYKFVLVMEDAVCNDYIGDQLWKASGKQLALNFRRSIFFVSQVLHVGSVPVYFGSPNVQDWLPTEESIINLSHYSSPIILAEHLKVVTSNLTEP